MKIKEITVSAGRTFNHPYEQFSNLKPEVKFVAELGESEDADAATKKLQAQAEGLVEDHKNHLLSSIEKIQQLRLGQQEVASLNREMVKAQERLDQIRKENPELLITNGTEDEL